MLATLVAAALLPVAVSPLAGTTVVMTRTSNRQDHWGPCVDVRGRAGNRIAER